MSLDDKDLLDLAGRLNNLHTPYAQPPDGSNLYHFDPADLWCRECRVRYPCATVLAMTVTFDGSE